MYPSENSPQGEWDHIAEDMLLKFAESGHPIFRATTPLSRGKLKSKGKGKVSMHFSAEPDTIDTIYRIILSVNQLSIYGAVAAICDEYEGQPDNTGEPVILESQSIVLGEVKAEAPAREEPEDSNILLQKYFQQVQRLSPENRLGKFCKEAGFMSVVEVGQYFVTRNASEFLLRTVACREYTLPRDDPASEAKGWIQGNTRIGPILEVTTSFQHFKFGVEVRIQSMKEDSSHSWVSHFSCTICSAAMAKRFQQDSGEERVTAKSRPMMNLIARTPSVVSSSTSLSPGKRDYGKQDPWRSVVADAHDRSGQPDKTSWSMVQQVRPHHGETLLDGDAQSVRYGGMLRDRSGQPDKINFQEVADSANFVMGSDASEFVNKVNDQVRKRQKRMSNVAGSGEEHSIIW